ncbi:RagB/SusD family nutrient uptake outer membrane protein [Flavitalea sp.]|nr:RagB/SusD family nutrient uptake outer membrane protein [Flavitalea sp.]
MKGKYLIVIAIITLSFASSCSKSYLEKVPLGTANETTLSNKKGVDAVLIGAYSLLDGVGSGTTASFSPASNWIYGSLTAGDAYKGSEPADQAILTTIERHLGQPEAAPHNDKWVAVYDGVSRSNDVLRLIAKTTDMTAAEVKQATGEARFLRGWYHFEAKKIWNNVPYLDENVTDFMVPNDKDIWPLIVADFQYAADNLSPTKIQPARASSWTAKAVLAKVYMFQHDYAKAKVLLDDVIDKGPYRLTDCYHDNFKSATENNSESVFEVQMSVNDGGNGQNGNLGDALNYTRNNGPGRCCGFFQPSQNLVNAFKTDVNGLPLLDTYNNIDVKNDQGILATQPFDPYTGTLDPRLDWTIGRRGIPYLDWGVFGGSNWVRNQSFGGPYAPKKNVYYQSERASLSQNNTSTANNIRVVRFADIILLRAEVAVEENDLPKALQLVNRVRDRAGKCVVTKTDGSPAANYLVKPYLSFPNKDYAKKAVQFERRLELAMEGHRFFDLVRWGVAAETINAYLQVEQTKRSYLNNTVFKKGTNEYMPLPQVQIDIMGSDILKQNPGY